MFLLLAVLSCDFISFSSIFNTVTVCSRFEEKDKLNDFSAPLLNDLYNYNFMVITDTHYGKNNQTYFNKLELFIKENDIEFAVVCGDITDSGFEEEYRTAVSDFEKSGVKVYPVIGNHDIYNNGYELYKEYFGRTVYTVEFGLSKLIFLDTANGILGNKQKSWYESQLKNNESGIFFVFTHYSPFDSLLQTPTAMPYPEETYYFTDINSRYNVNYMITGHLHRYDFRKVRDVSYVCISNISDGKNNVIVFKVRNGEVKLEVFNI